MDDIDFDIGSIGEPASPTSFPTQYNQVEQFCTPDSIAASSNYVNTLLTSYGYPVPLAFDSTDIQDKCKIVNCIYTLLNDKKNDEQERRELNSIIERMAKETKELQEQLVQVKRESQQKTKLYNETKSKLEANETSHKQRAVENNRLRDEVGKLKNNIQYVKSQYAHETKRHEQELTKTQERLLKLMNNHYKINIAQLSMNSKFETTEDNPADNDKVIQIRTMYNDLLTKSTEKERLARQENEDLRASLVKLYTSARRLLETQIQRFEQIKTTERNAFNETAKFRLPLDCGGKEAIEYIENLMASMKDEWDTQIKDQPPEYTEEDKIKHVHHISLLDQTIEDLLKSKAQSEQEYEKKLNMLKRFEQGGFFDTLYPTPATAYAQSDSEDDSIDDLNSDFSQFHVLKKKALKDQRRITESAVELSMQRDKLKAEQWAFSQLKLKSDLAGILDEGSPPVQEAPSVEPPRPSNSFNSTDFDRPRKRFRSFLGAPSVH